MGTGKVLATWPRVFNTEWHIAQSFPNCITCLKTLVKKCWLLCITYQQEGAQQLSQKPGTGLCPELPTPSQTLHQEQKTSK